MSRAILARLTTGEASVLELAEPFSMTLPAVSKHVKVLERAGLIARSRRAQWRPCRLEAEPLKEVAEWAGEFRRFWDASYERLDAWTNPRHVPQWLLGPPGWTMPVCEIDLRVGGAWRYVWRKSDGTEMAMGGFYREVTPPERVVSTQRWGPEWPETINTIAFAETGGRTIVTMTIKYPSREARDAALETGMKEGMDAGFARLDELLRRIA